MAGWHHGLNGQGFGSTQGVGDGQEGLAYCGSWVEKSWTQLSNWDVASATEEMNFKF